MELLLLVFFFSIEKNLGAFLVAPKWPIEWGFEHVMGHLQQQQPILESNFKSNVLIEIIAFGLNWVDEFFLDQSKNSGRLDWSIQKFSQSNLI